MNESKHAMIYARVATNGLNGSELSTQVAACRQYADQRGFAVVKDHIITEARSGATLKRLGLDKVQALAAGREIDVVIVTIPDRLSRDADHLLYLCEEWRRIGIEVHYLTR